MREGDLTLVLMRDAGRAPITLRLGKRQLLASAFALAALMALLAWVGFRIGELTL